MTFVAETLFGLKRWFSNMFRFCKFMLVSVKCNSRVVFFEKKKHKRFYCSIFHMKCLFFSARQPFPFQNSLFFCLKKIENILIGSILKVKHFNFIISPKINVWGFYLLCSPNCLFISFKLKHLIWFFFQLAAVWKSHYSHNYTPK